MKRFRFLVFMTAIVSLISLSNCQTEEPDIDRIDKIYRYFTVEVDLMYLTNHSDVWMFVADDKGMIMGFKRIPAPGRYEFIKPAEDSVSDQIGVYILSVEESSETYNMWGYLNIDKGDSWVLKDANDTPDPVGSAKVVIANFPDVVDGALLLANNNTSGLAQQGMEKIDHSDSDGVIDTVKFTMPLVQESDTLLIGNAYKDNDARYIRIEGVHSDDIIELDFLEDFVPYEQVITYDAQSNGHVFSYVQAYRKDELFRHSVRLTDGASTFTQFGYVDGFDFYHTYLSVQNVNGFADIGFEKRGGVTSTDEFEIPQIDFTITDPSFSTFDFNFSGDLDYYRSTWSVSNGGVITIYSTVNDPVQQVQSIPQGIIEKFEYVNLSNLQYEESSFTSVVEGYSYNQYIEENFREGEIAEDVKMFSFRK